MQKTVPSSPLSTKNPLLANSFIIETNDIPAEEESLDYRLKGRIYQKCFSPLKKNEVLFARKATEKVRSRTRPPGEVKFIYAYFLPKPDQKTNIPRTKF